MTQDRKDALERMIQDVIREFNEYQSTLDSTINNIKSGNIQPPQPPTQPTQTTQTP